MCDFTDLFKGKKIVSYRQIYLYLRTGKVFHKGAPFLKTLERLHNYNVLH